MCMGNSEDTSEGTLNVVTPKSPHIPRRMSIREVASKKFSDLRRTLSFRAQSKTGKRIHYEGLRRRQREEIGCDYHQISRCPDHTSRDIDVTMMSPIRHESDFSVLGSIEFIRLPMPSQTTVESTLKENKWRIHVTEQTSDEETVEITNISDRNVDNSARKLLMPPSSSCVCRTTPCRYQESQLSKISTVDVTSGSRPISRTNTFSSLLAKERRQRIQKLQSDIVNIQKDLKDLEDLEYMVTKV